MLLDADLAILGAPAAEYQEYAVQVRQEYSHVPEAVYRPARCQVLEGFLKKPVLYQTAFFHAAFETTARENISEEIRRLHLP